MAVNIYDLDAEGVAKIITDNASPSLDISNTNSSGSGLLTDTQATTSIASLAQVESARVNALREVITGNATATVPLQITRSVLQGVTVAPVQIIASTASSCFFDFQGAVISTASINLAANQTAGFVQVRVVGTGGEAVGFLPIFKGVA